MGTQGCAGLPSSSAAGAGLPSKHRGSQGDSMGWGKAECATTRCLSHTTARIHHQGCSLKPELCHPACLSTRFPQKGSQMTSPPSHLLHQHDRQLAERKQGHSIPKGQKTAWKKFGKESPQVQEEKPRSGPASQRGGQCDIPCGWPTVNEAAGCSKQAEAQALCLSLGRSPQPASTLLKHDCYTKWNYWSYKEMKARTFPLPKKRGWGWGRWCPHGVLRHSDLHWQHAPASLVLAISGTHPHWLISLLQAKYENDSLR